MSLRCWIEKGSTTLSKKDENKAAKSHHQFFLCNQIDVRLGVVCCCVLLCAVVCVRGASGNGTEGTEKKKER